MEDIMFQRHGFRFWGPEGRMFQKGDFKYLILDLLNEKPRYGYEIIRELEEKFHGFYTPSPGSVYPTLQYLEEMGYVTSSQQDGKKIYTITEEGRNYLAGQKDVVDGMKEHWKSGWQDWTSDLRDDFRDMMNDLRELGRKIGQKARKINKDKLRKIQGVISKASSEIESILKE
jgi:DNA-binding PadR family transcriptional regulator